MMDNCLRGRLHGEFQPGLKFQLRKGAGILLWLHDEFQPGLKYKPRHQIEIVWEELSENQELL